MIESGDVDALIPMESLVRLYLSGEPRLNGTEYQYIHVRRLERVVTFVSTCQYSSIEASSCGSV